MNDKVLFKATRTIITRNFILSIFAMIIGLIILICGFIAMDMIGSFFIIVGLAVILISGIAALVIGFGMRSNTIEFYENKYVIKSGIINRHENEALLTNIVSVRVSQGLGGRMFDYGIVHVNIVGKHDINLAGVKHPHKLKKYIESIMNKTNMNGINQVIHEYFTCQFGTFLF